MNLWAKTVKKVYDQNKHKPGYKLKNAMRDAKKIYHKVKKGGDGDAVVKETAVEVERTPDGVEVEEEKEVAPAVGGRRRRRRTRKRSRKHRRH